MRRDTKVCFYRGRHEEFNDFSSQEDAVVFCDDFGSVMEVLGHEYNPEQWRLFINLLAPELFFLILAHAVYKM